MVFKRDSDVLFLVFMSDGETKVYKSLEKALSYCGKHNKSQKRPDRNIAPIRFVKDKVNAFESLCFAG